MGSLTTRAIAAAGILAVVACDSPCEFRIVERLPSTGSVGCCGGSSREDVVVGAHRDLAVDIAQTAIADQQGGQDLFLTGPDCTRLFDEPYAAPGTAPPPVARCPVVLGPVSRGRVSPRAEVEPGRYRLFVQAYDTNQAANSFHAELNIWGATCGRTPAGP
jgi:hypothetical protein